MNIIKTIYFLTYNKTWLFKYFCEMRKWSLFSLFIHYSLFQQIAIKPYYISGPGDISVNKTKIPVLIDFIV